MAMSATIALVQSPISFNQVSRANITISNSGGSPVNIIGIQPVISNSGDPSYEINQNSQASSLPQGFGQVFVSPAGGSVVVPMDYLVNSPQRSGSLSQSSPASYLVGCICYTSDGSCFSPSPASLTVSPLS